MRIVICGAGIAGLSLAQRLGTLGWDVVVLERAPGPRTQGYMIDFFGTGYDAAESMGVMPRLLELGYHIEEATFVDEAGRRRGALKYSQFAEVVGGQLVSIMRPDLELALRESLPPAVDVRWGTTLTGVDAGGGGVTLTLSDGSTLRADLLAGADGIHSTVRRLVFGEERRWLRHLGFHTAAFTFEDPEIHALAEGRFLLTDTIGRQMGLYGLRNGRVAVFAVHETQDQALPADAPAAVRAAYGTLGWIVPRVLELCPPHPSVYYDQVAQIMMPEWSRGRVVLLGDACQAVSLVAGQGASLGVGGAYVLAEQLAGSDRIEAALEAYERMWRPIVEEKQKVGRDAARWFLPESRLQLRLRRLMIAASRLPVVDRLVAVSIAGKSSAIIRQLGAPPERRGRIRGSRLHRRC